jgi:hypothetical protein
MCPGTNGARDPRGNDRPSGTAKPPGGNVDEAGGLAHRCLAAVAARMPADREDWGRAMVAELDQIRPGTARWRFVLGAARVALVPPGRSRPGRYALLAAIGGAVGAAMAAHALAPAAGAAAAVSVSGLAVLAVWGLAGARTRAGRWDRVPAAHFAVVAGSGGCLALILATVQRYPAELSLGWSYWAALLFIDAVVASYLMLAWWLPRKLRPVRRNHLYALAAGVAVAIPAVYYIEHPSLPGLDNGPFPGGWAWLVAFLAPLGAAFLASGSRGRLQDGLEAATWAALLSGLTMSIMIMAATYRVLPGAASDPHIVAEAHHHGVASAASWLASDNLGGATILLVWLPVLAFCLANFGITLGCSWAPPGSRGQGATGPRPPHRPQRSRPGSQASRVPNRTAPHPGT